MSSFFGSREIMTLTELRKEWERHKTVELEVVKNKNDGDKVVFVILSDGIRRCWVYRYFKSDDGWEVSSEVEYGEGMSGLRECFEVISESFSELMPDGEAQ